MNDQPILHADDDDNDVIFLNYAFKQANITNRLYSLSGGEQVVDYLSGQGEFADRALHPLPGLVLLDLKMPRLNGLETLSWIRAQPALRPLIVIIFTASANQCDVDDAYRLGANSFLIKPAGTDRLTDLIKALHAYWFGCNRFARLPVGDRLAAQAHYDETGLLS